jgi:hypothetical protein
LLAHIFNAFQRFALEKLKMLGNALISTLFSAFRVMRDARGTLFRNRAVLIACYGFSAHSRDNRVSLSQI